MNELQSTGLKRNTIDKYYTKQIIAEQCCKLVKKYIKELIIYVNVVILILKNQMLFLKHTKDGIIMNKHKLKH